ncbi:MAG: glycosyltransferase [Rhizobiaceae bacterium]|nr:glycosyltransferase [Rhizobiaceae bacterium]
MKHREEHQTVAAARGGPLAGRRMLFVAPDDYPAYRVDLTELFSRHLVNRGLSIDWSLHRVDVGPAAIDDRGAERFILPAHKKGGILAKIRNRISNGAQRWGLVRKVARGEYDLVQVRDYIYWGLPFLIAARIARKPFVYWMSFPVLEMRWELAVRPYVPISLLGRAANFAHALLGKLVFYRFLGYADHVVVQSRRMRERLEEQGVARDLMTPVEMGVSTERFNREAVEASRDPRIAGRPVLIYVCSSLFGRLFDTAVGALAAARRRGHDAVLVAVGPLAEHERDALPQTLERHGIPQDAFISTGMLPLKELLSYVKAADVCLSPVEMTRAHEVASPTKLVEYLAMGRPVVASVHYDQNDVVGSSGAGLIAAMNGEAMGEAAARLLADREWAEEMGAKGPAWVKANRDYARLADRVERLYAGVLERQSTSAIEAASQPAE